MKKLLVLMLSVITLLAASAAVHAEQNVVNVSTIDELLAAINSNTKIVMAPGAYNVPAKPAEWDPNYMEGESIRIENITNLEFVGADNTEVTLAVGYLPVFDIINSNNITFTGLTIGHSVPEYACEGEGDCISINKSSNIVINDCDLYGCGVKAVSGYGAANVVISNSIMRDCMSNAISLYNLCGNVEINNCKLYGNAYAPFDSEYYSFVEATAAAGYDCSVTFNHCEIYDNKNTAFESAKHKNRAIVNCNACKIYNNVWETTVAVMTKSRWFEGEYEKVIFGDQLPIIIESRAMIPARKVFEHMGYTVEWNDETKVATIINEDKTKTVEIPVNSKVLYVNGEGVSIDVPGQIINDRTYLPLRAISEAFGLEVVWKGDIRTVIIG